MLFWNVSGIVKIVYTCLLSNNPSLTVLQWPRTTQINWPVENKEKTRLPASRSSSIGPEGRFSFFHPKVKVKERMSLRCPSSLKKNFFAIWESRGKGGLDAIWQKWKWKWFKAILANIWFLTPPPLILPRGGGSFDKNEVNGLKVHFKSF